MTKIKPHSIAINHNFQYNKVQFISLVILKMDNSELTDVDVMRATIGTFIGSDTRLDLSNMEEETLRGIWERHLPFLYETAIDVLTSMIPAEVETPSWVQPFYEDIIHAGEKVRVGDEGMAEAFRVEIDLLRKAPKSAGPEAEM
jgi:hypothetical protein